MNNEDLKFPVSTLDNILAGFTIQDLIDAVYCNEAWKDEIRVKKVFNELLEAQQKEAKETLRQNMQLILKELNK